MLAGVVSFWNQNGGGVRLPEFFLGVLAARLVLDGTWRNTRLTPPLLALAVAYVATWGWCW